MRRWRTVAALKAVVKQSLERNDRASSDNRVRKTIPRLWRPNGEELFALLTILNGFKNIFTPYTRTRVTETWFPNPPYFLDSVYYFVPLNRVSSNSSLFESGEIKELESIFIAFTLHVVGNFCRTSLDAF